MDAQRSPVLAVGVDTALSVSNNFWGACITRPQPDYVVCWSALTAAPVPARILGFSSGRVRQLALAQTHGCAVDEAGQVSCWGTNMYGELGDGTMDPHDAARSVLSGAQAVATGLGRSCALLAAGQVSCWGMTAGLLDPMPQPSPTVVAGLEGVAAIGGGSVASATCAVRTEGSVLCWGLDLAELASSGTEVYDSVPSLVAGLTDIESVSVGRAHACAVARDGAVFCWGTNDSGQLGNNTTSASATPVRVSGL